MDLILIKYIFIELWEDSNKCRKINVLFCSGDLLQVYKPIIISLAQNHQQSTESNLSLKWNNLRDYKNL